ncbi:recombinase family protein [Candidatus Poribacteria bacterium]
MLTLLAFERLLSEYDIELHTIEGQIDTSTPTGFMSYAMRAFVGEMERRQIKYRTKQALQHKKQKDEVVGKIPYGHRRDGDMLIEDPAEQQIRKMANRMYNRGKSVAEVMAALNKKDLKTRTGRRWTNIQVQRMLDGYDSVYQKTSKLGERIREFILAIA